MHTVFWGRVVVGLAMGVFLVVPASVGAATASPQAVLDAVAAASAAGFCTESTQQLADCQKTTIRCDGGTRAGWGSYVADYFELVGGSVQAKSVGPTVITTIDPVSRLPIQQQTASVGSAPVEALDYLRADWSRNSKTPPGPIQKGTCYCACREDDSHESCAGQPAGFPIGVGENLAYEECAARCSPRTVASEKCSIQPIAPTLAGTPASTAGLLSDAQCFTPAECAEQQGIFEAEVRCGTKGRCYAAEPPVTLQVPLGEVTEIQGLNQYVVAGYRYGIAIVAIAATVMFVYGAFLYLIGSALPSLGRGKQIMMDAILGMILVFSATMILRTLNPATTQLDPVKVYLVNSRQFVIATQCRDLGPNTRVAFAGVKPQLTPYETVAAREGAFDRLATATECGQSYWIDGTNGQSCDGSQCPNRGEACVSCADEGTRGCGGVASDARVCVKTTFAGTIDFIDGKYPLALEVVAFCNHAQGTDPDAVEDHLTIVERTTPERVGRRANAGATAEAGTTDEDEIGRSGYLFDDLQVDDIAEAETYCTAHGGIRGFVLAVAYKEPFSSSGVTLDDVAVLSRTNCRSSRFDGYADGSRANMLVDTLNLSGATGITLPRKADVASAVACGVRQGRFQTGPGTFWSGDDLRSALVGDAPIVCDFTLSGSSAPSDPGTTFCQ